MSWNDAIELLSKATPKYTSGGFPLPGETVKPDPIVSPAVKEAKKTELVYESSILKFVTRLRKSKPRNVITTGLEHAV